MHQTVLPIAVAALAILAWRARQERQLVRSSVPACIRAMPSVARRVVRVANAVGAQVARWRLAAPLELAKSLEDARRETGLDDFGGDGFHEPLARLIDALEREAQLSALGRIIARTRIHGHLVNRIRITADRKREPSIAHEPIRKNLRDHWPAANGHEHLVSNARPGRARVVGSGVAAPVPFPPLPNAARARSIADFYAFAPTKSS